MLVEVTPMTALSTASWRSEPPAGASTPRSSIPATDEDAEEAKAICSMCPTPGLPRARLANREREGVWGGATERERRRIVRQRRKTA